MSEAVTVALITSGIMLIGNVLTLISNNRLVSYKVEELRRDFADLRARVDKHNTLVERMAIVEQSAKSAHKRLDEMKEGH